VIRLKSILRATAIRIKKFFGTCYLLKDGHRVNLWHPLKPKLGAGFPNPRDLQPGELDAQGIRKHLQCYLHLREAVRGHIQGGQQPTLQLHKSLALQEQCEAFRQLGISETAIDEINIEQVDFEDDNFIPENHRISTSLDEVTGPRATDYFRS